MCVSESLQCFALAALPVLWHGKAQQGVWGFTAKLDPAPLLRQGKAKTRCVEQFTAVTCPATLPELQQGRQEQEVAGPGSVLALGSAARLSHAILLRIASWVW